MIVILPCPVNIKLVFMEVVEMSVAGLADAGDYIYVPADVDANKRAIS
jgi:hypothetical protein